MAMNSMGCDLIKVGTCIALVVGMALVEHFHSGLIKKRWYHERRKAWNVWLKTPFIHWGNEYNVGKS